MVLIKSLVGMGRDRGAGKHTSALQERGIYGWILQDRTGRFGKRWSMR